MSFASKYNRTRKFDIDTTGFEYAALADLFNDNGANKVYPVCGIYINTKGKFNDSPVIATDKCYVNFPAHMTDTCREILQDADAIDEINKGHVGFKIYTYHQAKYDKDCFGVEFVDM